MLLPPGHGLAGQSAALSSVQTAEPGGPGQEPVDGAEPGDTDRQALPQMLQTRRIRGEASSLPLLGITLKTASGKGRCPPAVLRGGAAR